MYVAPHQLCGVTLHEDDHPNTEEDTVRAVITHHAGPVPTKLSEGPAKDAIQGQLYTVYTVESDSWEVTLGDATTLINNKGASEGFCVAAANKTAGDKRFAAVFHWNSLFQHQLEEQMRPAGCAGCNIF
jgi:hypothetical protein